MFVVFWGLTCCRIWGVFGMLLGLVGKVGSYKLSSCRTMQTYEMTNDSLLGTIFYFLHAEHDHFQMQTIKPGFHLRRNRRRNRNLSNNKLEQKKSK